MDLIHLYDCHLRNSVGISARSYRWNDCYPIMHGHDFFEFEYIVSGTGYHYVNDRRYEISPGDFWGFGLEDFHRYEVRDVEMRNLNVLFLQTNAEMQKLLSAQCFPIHGNIPSPKRKQVEELFHMVETTFHESSPYLDQRLSGLTIALLTEYFEHAEKQLTTRSSSTYQYIQSALQYINTHCHELVTLQETADAINVSASYLSSIFSGYVGCHFPEYLTRTRLKKACVLLADQSISITEIASQTGFGCTATMNRAFQRYQGTSPSLFRKKNT